jgi:hypothetical protein
MLRRFIRVKERTSWNYNIGSSPSPALVITHKAILSKTLERSSGPNISLSKLQVGGTSHGI